MQAPPLSGEGAPQSAFHSNNKPGLRTLYTNAHELFDTSRSRAIRTCGLILRTCFIRLIRLMSHGHYRLTNCSTSTKRKIMCYGSAVCFGISLWGCGTTPSLKAQPKKPDINIQPQTAPDLIPVAAGPVERTGQKSDVEVTGQTMLITRETSIYFPPRLTLVDSEGKAKLKVCADRLNQDTKKIVVLVGYTDGLGSKSYNLAITDQRIASVNSVLRSYGVPSKQIRRNRSNSVKTAPNCRTEICYQQKHRVEFICGA